MCTWNMQSKVRVSPSRALITFKCTLEECRRFAQCSVANINNRWMPEIFFGYSDKEWTIECITYNTEPLK